MVYDDLLLAGYEQIPPIGNIILVTIGYGVIDNIIWEGICRQHRPLVTPLFPLAKGDAGTNVRHVEPSIRDKCRIQTGDVPKITTKEV